MTIDLPRLSVAILGLALTLAGCEHAKPPIPTSQKTASDSDTAEKSNAKDADGASAQSGAVVAIDPAATEGKPSNKAKLGSPELTAGIPGSGPLKIEDLKVWLDDPKNHEVLEVELPLGLDAGAGQLKGLEENPLTRAKIELGRQLYFDNRLSADGTVSCASCHHPEEGFAKHTQFGVGISKQEGGRNSPASYNRILSDAQFWDGRASSLEEQAKGPIQNPIEMGNTHEACIECLKAVPAYELQINKIFGEFSIDAVAKAIASFERALVTSPSPFDYYERFRPMQQLDPDDLKDDDPELFAKYEAAKAEMEAHPMSESAKRGREIFFGVKGGCTACHVGPNLTDEKYHNLGVGMDKEKPDIGREEVTKDEKDRGAFKTPTIRNVALTAPYMHDGSQKTLAEVVEWYNKGGHANPHLSDKIKKLDLTDQDKADLVAFMEACTGEFPKVETNRLPE
jgi:cytochrome c peroxidase